MTRLSVAMIVRDEAPRLGACLAPLRDCVDELVVVDTGSTDGTPELAASLGARVHAFPWIEDFSAARNESLRHCTGDWVLALDADECLEPAFARDLRGLLAQHPYEGGLLTVRNYLPSGAYRGIHGAPMPNPGSFPGTEALAYCTEFPALRLARRLPGLAFSGRVHEVLDPCFEARGWRAAPLPGLLHHFGKGSPERESAKQAAYFRMAERDAAERPGEARSHYNLMQEAAMVGAWGPCARAAEAYRALDPAAPLKVFLDGARALTELGRAEGALDWLDQGGPRFSRDAAWWSARGAALTRLARPEAATAAYLEAIDLDPRSTESFLGLARLLADRQEPDRARSLLEAGLDQNPRDLLLWEALVGLGSETGDLAIAARDAWNALQVLPEGGRGLWHQLVVHALVALGDEAGAEEVRRRGRRSFPGLFPE